MLSGYLHSLESLNLISQQGLVEKHGAVTLDIDIASSNVVTMQVNTIASSICN